jgi:hypothetical protein
MGNHKKEMYPLYFPSKCFQYYLVVGKSVIVERDHRTLLKMELSDAAMASKQNVIPDYLRLTVRNYSALSPPTGRESVFWRSLSLNRGTVFA